MDTRALLESVERLISDNMAEVQAGRYNITYKSDGSPVTSSDQFLERLVRAHIEQHLPDLVFVGEESYDFQSPSQDGYVALLDPIDGTENFCSGLKEWGVSLSIWRKGRHLGSMLMMPELNERLITGDDVPPVYSRITGLSSSFNEGIVDALRNAVEYRVTGCAVYNLLNVIRGSFARFINPKGAYAWDLLPGLMLALEHNCLVRVNDEVFNGQFLDPSQRYRVDIQHRYDLHRR
ncbi:inositol monophosphatase family protein [uncultured Aquabacterium sp.]|uniref:inositol monophosphatase family protein n=1 Tax=uncultured Aquabacterium sp. TaxID=158753 RepID=UPI0025D09280|nr:inositol monophosphatase family protein [uncultured Aquabacterium sp.]